MASHVGSTDTYNFTYALSETGTKTRTVMELGTPVGLLYALSRIGFFGGHDLFRHKDSSVPAASPHVLPLSFFLFWRKGYQGDLLEPRPCQVLNHVGCAFILGAYYLP